MSSASLKELTPRELEILTLIGEGYSLPEIAQRLHRSIKTVETHRLTLGRKLAAGNRVELARIAISSGLVKLNMSDTTSPPMEQQALQQLQGKADALTRIEQINRIVNASTGPTYLRRLSCAMTQVLDIQYAGICELVESDGKQISNARYFARDGVLQDPVMYQVQSTPCEATVTDGHTACASNVMQAYPEDEYLQQLSAQSYAGVRLDDESGKPIGILWLTDSDTLQEPETTLAVLQFFAPRAAAELDRTLDKNRDLEEVEAMARDIDQKNKQLTHSNARFDTLLTTFHEFSNQMADGLLTIDNNQTITFANPSLAAMVGYTPDELLGKHVSILYPPEEKERFEIDHREYREKGTVVSFEASGMHKDGSRISVMVARGGLFNNDGEVVGTISFVTRMNREPAKP